MLGGGFGAWEDLAREVQVSIRLQRVGAVLGRIIICVLVGATLSTLIWTTNFLVKGQFIEALQGDVEDACGLFWGLFSLGTFAGVVVGVAWGLQNAVGSQRTTEKRVSLRNNDPSDY